MLINAPSSLTQSSSSALNSQNSSGRKSSSPVENQVNQTPARSPSRSELNADLAQQRELQQLKTIDRQVRAHERAHLSAAGRYATSSATYSFQKGPDGRLYAVAGEVGIDISPVPGDPQATLLKAQTVARAALAPANPSAQDRMVAAQATALAQQARIDIAKLEKTENTRVPGEILDAFA